MSEFHSLQCPHLSVKGPSFLPNWLFGYAYPHNVIGAGNKDSRMQRTYCSYLPLPVFPTPFYETDCMPGIVFTDLVCPEKIQGSGNFIRFLPDYQWN